MKNLQNFYLSLFINGTKNIQLFVFLIHQFLSGDKYLRIGKPARASAAIGRIMHHGKEIIINGKNLRLPDYQNR